MKLCCFIILADVSRLFLFFTANLRWEKFASLVILREGNQFHSRINKSRAASQTHGTGERGHNFTRQRSRPAAFASIKSAPWPRRRCFTLAAPADVEWRAIEARQTRKTNTDRLGPIPKCQVVVVVCQGFQFFSIMPKNEVPRVRPRRNPLVRLIDASSCSFTIWLN